MKLVLNIAYDGSKYQGFQKQPRGRTVQKVLEVALEELFLESIPSTGAGRTDTGVHADEQVITVELPDALVLKIGFTKLAWVLNNKLPPSIRITNHFRVAEAFHPRFGASVRLYRYSIFLQTSPTRSGATLTKSFLYTFPLKRDNLLRMLRAFEGTHDFTTFASSCDSSASKVRTLYKVDCLERGHELIIELYGNAFLRAMVRSIIGNALMLIRKGKSEETVLELLARRDPKLARARVPGYALTLTRIFYTPLFVQPAKTLPSQIWS